MVTAGHAARQSEYNQYKETCDFREANTEHPGYGGFADVRLMRSVGAVVSEHRRINETSSTVKGGESATSIPARRNRHFSRRDTDRHRLIVSEHAATKRRSAGAHPLADAIK